MFTIQAYHQDQPMIAADLLAVDDVRKSHRRQQASYLQAMFLDFVEQNYLGEDPIVKESEPIVFNGNRLSFTRRCSLTRLEEDEELKEIDFDVLEKVDRAHKILMVIEEAERERSRREEEHQLRRQILAAHVSRLLKVAQHEKLHQHLVETQAEQQQQQQQQHNGRRGSCGQGKHYHKCHKTGGEDNVCKFFLRGRCKKGAQCKFNHPYLHMCPWCGDELGNKVTSHLRACAALAKKRGIKI